MASPLPPAAQRGLIGTELWQALPDSLQANMLRHGLHEADVFRSLFTEGDVGADEIMRDFCDPQPVGDDIVVIRERLLLLRDVSGGAASRASARRASFSTVEAAAAVTVSERKRKAEGQTVCFAAGAASLTPASMPAPQGEPDKWLTRLRRSLALAGDPSGRRKAEDSERQRWASEVAAIVEEAKLPSAQVAEGMHSKETALLRAARGRRASTLRRRVRDWRKARRYFLLTTGQVWPRGVAAALEYVEVCAESPSGKGLALDFLNALTFMERGGGVAPADSLHRNELLITAVADVRGAETEDPRGRGQAPRLPLSAAIALERLILTQDAPKFVRMMAWFKLIKLWGALRFDDHRGLVPRSVSLRENGLHATLERTKTSGPGKTRQHLPLFVAKGATLLD